MKRKITLMISIILSMTMALGTIASAALPSYGEEYENQPNKSYVQSFNDVPKSYWAFDYIMEMTDRGVFSGYPNGRFYPNNTITRAEFAKIMCISGGLNISTVTSTSYSDVSPLDWYAPYVESGRYYLSGYVSGGKKYYMPNSNALREDIAVALVKLKGYDVSIYDESMLKTMFKDWQSISSDARKYVSVAVEQGLISGYEDDTFRGQNTITRAEAATLLWRAYQYGSGNKVFDTESEEVFEREEIEEPANNNITTVPEKENENSKSDFHDDAENDDEYNNADNECDSDDSEYIGPSPKYTHEIDTLVTNSGPVFSAIGTDNSYVYSPRKGSYPNFYATEIYELKNGKKKKLIDMGDIDYLGNRDLSKEEESRIKGTVIGLGFNEYDSCPYAILSQDYSNTGYYLYNLYTNEYEEISTNGDRDYGSKKKEFCIDSNGEAINFSQFGMWYDGAYTINNVIYYAGTSEYIDSRSGKCKSYDWFIEDAEICGANNNSHFAIGNNSIYSVYTNGDHEFICHFDDINNIDHKSFEISYAYIAHNGSFAASNNGDIYFYDGTHDSIRCIKKI